MLNPELKPLPTSLLCLANEKGPIVEVMYNGDVIVHQEGSIPEAARLFYSSLGIEAPVFTDGRLREIAGKAALAAAKNAGTAPQLLFADIYFTLQEELLKPEPLKGDVNG